MTRYSISAEQLLKHSKNKEGVINTLKESAKLNNLNITDNSIIYSISSEKNGVENYDKDAERGVKVDDKHFYLGITENELEGTNNSREELWKQIGRRAEKMKKHYSQALATLLLAWIPKVNQAEDMMIRPIYSEENVGNYLYTKDNKDYMEISVSHFEVKCAKYDSNKDFVGMQSIGIIPANLKVLYELTDQGFELINITTDSLRLIHYYLEEVTLDKFLKEQHLLFLQDGVKNITNLLALKDKYDQQIQSISYAYIIKHKYPKLDKFRSLFPKLTNPQKEYIKPTNSQREYIILIAEIARAQLFALSKMISTNSNELTQQDLKLITDIKNPKTDMNHFLTHDLNIPQTQLDILLNKIPPITPRAPSRSSNT